MALKIQRLSYALGAEVMDADLSKPLSDAAWREINQAFVDYSLLLFRDQRPARAQYVAFGRRFGKLSTTQSSPEPDYPEISCVVSKPRVDGTAEADYNGSDWHSDISYRVSPNIITMLRAIDLPAVGGDTQFANMYLAYETLSEKMKQLIDGLEGVHIQQEKDLDHSSPEKLEASRRDKTAAQALVRVHPESGRKCLYVSDKTMLIAGMTPEESRPLLDFLRLHSCRPQFVYVHQWRKDDILVWDQRCLNHNAVGNFDRSREYRRLEKLTVLGPPSGRPFNDVSGTRNLTHAYVY